MLGEDFVCELHTHGWELVNAQDQEEDGSILFTNPGCQTPPAKRCAAPCRHALAMHFGQAMEGVMFTAR